MQMVDTADWAINLFIYLSICITTYDEEQVGREKEVIRV